MRALFWQGRASNFLRPSNALSLSLSVSLCSSLSVNESAMRHNPHYNAGTATAKSSGCPAISTYVMLVQAFMPDGPGLRRTFWEGDRGPGGDDASFVQPLDDIVPHAEARGRACWGMCWCVQSLAPAVGPLWWVCDVGVCVCVLVCDTAWSRWGTRRPMMSRCFKRVELNRAARAHIQQRLGVASHGHDRCNVQQRQPFV